MPGKILIIAYEFPPVVAAGMYRPFRLAKHIGKFGWQPFVLTGNADFPHTLKDSLDVENFIDNSRIFRAGITGRKTTVKFIKREIACKELQRRLLEYQRGITWFCKSIRLPFYEPWVIPFPDGCIRWVPEAYYTAMDIIEKHNIDVLFTTSFPFSSTVIGYLIREKLGLPWIAEFRDLWTEDPRFGIRDGAFFEDSVWLERKVLEASDGVVAFSKPLRDKFFKSSGKNEEKFHTIEDSYDASEFNFPKEIKSDKFRLVHIGTVYKEMIPTNLVKAIEILLKMEKIDRRRFEFIIIGTDLTGRTDYFNSLGFITKGYLPHKEVFAYYRQAAALLLTLPKKLRDFIPSRLFEYLASERPILALLPPDGAAANIIKKSRAGDVIDFDADVTAIADGLYTLYKRWEDKRNEFTPDREFIEGFNNNKMASRFAALFNSVL